jgi:carboxymethylenebutenolidase
MEVVLGKHVSLTAVDKFMLGGYRADPAGAPKGAIVVIQEIFGVNNNIRTTCDEFAAQGYVAIAPALFDRKKKNFESGYSPDEVAAARKFLENPDIAAMLRDTQAAIDEVKAAGPVGIVGYCLGGSIAFLAATRLSGLKAAVGYYGGMIAKNAGEKPKIPVMLHFGASDPSIPMSDVELVKQKRPELEVHVYEGAGHAFSNSDRPNFHAPSAELAGKRTRDFFAKHLK